MQGLNAGDRCFHKPTGEFGIIVEIFETEIPPNVVFIFDADIYESEVHLKDLTKA